MALSGQYPLLAQKKIASGPQQIAASVPFVGCKSDGQVGPVEAPTGASRSLPLGPAAAKALAYYRSAQGAAVLAPRGWYCLGDYGSGGDSLFVSPQPIDTKTLFSPVRGGLAGPAVTVVHRYGMTSGRFSVAEIIARVFPAYKAFATGVADEFSPPVISLPSGPYPTDSLTYKSKAVVEYMTPGQRDGLGTYWWLKKDASPIAGAAVLVGNPPDLLLLAMRVPAELNSFEPAVLDQFEREAKHLPNR